MQKPPNPLSIALIATPGAQEAALHGLADLFTVANRFAPGSLTATRIDSPSQTAFDILLFPPSLTGARAAPDHPLTQWARTQHAQGARLCSVCAGAFWLGAAGLLDHRPVTTHWALEDEFRTAFPKAHLNPEHILIDDHDIVTAGGLMAWVDLGLFLVGQAAGPAVVSQTARHLLVDPSGREQRTYRAFRPNRAHGDAAILTVQTWLETHHPQPLQTADMAATAHMSERSFLRRFHAATGLTPAAYLQHLRVEKARGLLERTPTPVNEIAWAVGYADPSAFARVFRHITGVTAGEYRRRFAIAQPPSVPIP